MRTSQNKIKVVNTEQLYFEQIAAKERIDSIKKSKLFNGDCFDIMNAMEELSVHSIVTDPPYGVKEYEDEQLAKRKDRIGGIWRLPPAFDNANRAPLPRFTALSEKEMKIFEQFFIKWGKLALKVLMPGGHVFIATNSVMAAHLYTALMSSGLEFRGQIIRLVRTFRGGDRPKNAETEFDSVCSLPRGCFEPWGIFRKPLPNKMTVSDCLRQFQTGGLQRISSEKPFEDVIHSERTSTLEKKIADHPSLKPQSFMRKIVHASLPLNVGTILDPFMGAGSTIAAAENLGFNSIGIEKDLLYFKIALQAILPLSQIKTG